MMVPRSVLQLIQKRIFSFLWTGKLISTNFHMVSWSSLCLPKNMGGWGVNINIFWFGDALGARTLWRVLFNNNLLSDVVKRKYIKNVFIHQWLRDSPSVPATVSIIWKGIFKRLQTIRSMLGWIIGRGVHMYNGIDSIVGLKD